MSNSFRVKAVAEEAAGSSKVHLHDRHGSHGFLKASVITHSAPFQGEASLSPATKQPFSGIPHGNGVVDLDLLQEIDPAD